MARTPTGTLDGPVRRLSAAADKSKLWLGIAAVVALAGGKRGRRAALEGVVAIGVSSATINLGVARRRRLLLGSTGVHYPGDVVIGSVAGSGTAAMIAAVADRAARSRAVSDRAR